MLQITTLSLLLTGCGKKPGSYTPPTSDTSNVPTATTNSALAEADSMWAERGNKERLIQTLDLYEKALATDSQNKHIIGRLVRGWYFLGDVHESEKSAKMTAWDKAVSFGDICLEQSQEYSTTLEETNKKE